MIPEPIKLKLLTYSRIGIFSVEAKHIKKTVDGTTIINNKYKEYDIKGKLHESYTAPYERTQQDVKSTIGNEGAFAKLDK